MSTSRTPGQQALDARRARIATLVTLHGYQVTTAQADYVARYLIEQSFSVRQVLAHRPNVRAAISRAVGVAHKAVSA